MTDSLKEYTKSILKPRATFRNQLRGLNGVIKPFLFHSQNDIEHR
ncbi:hypothetical protein D1BOALGB6SA_3972 [Olavius sp. associated proteobacterium Delta 1]|nr:hypothetical protein D1BOALGB6SA_3972 [Olavius sp. associated proteobacterium Delta 1]